MKIQRSVHSDLRMQNYYEFNGDDSHVVTRWGGGGSLITQQQEMLQP